jgi:hypothetical protein
VYHSAMSKNLVRHCFLQLSLNLQSTLRKLLVMGLQQEGIQTADMIDATQRLGGHAEFEVPAQLFRGDSDIAQVRQKATAGSILGVGNIVSSHHTSASQFAATRHSRTFQTVKSVRTDLGSSAGAGELPEETCAVKRDAFI